MTRSYSIIRMIRSQAIFLQLKPVPLPRRCIISARASMSSNDSGTKDGALCVVSASCTRRCTSRSWLAAFALISHVDHR